MEKERQLLRQILNNLIPRHFTGENEKILKSILSELPYKNLDEFADAVLPSLLEEVNIEALNYDQIAKLDLVEIAKRIAESMNCTTLSSLSGEQMEKFDTAVKSFFYSALHDVAFPILALENPDMAARAQDLLTQVVSSMGSHGIDSDEIFRELNIENLPISPSMELFIRLGGKFPGIESPSIEEIKNSEEESEKDRSAPSHIYCELTSEQTIYLAYILETDYCLIKKWRQFADILKSNGKRYDSIIVDSDRKKLGLLLSVINVLYERKTPLGDRYLRTERGNGVWLFFQGYLMEEDNTFFTRPLRKCYNENKDEEKAGRIINDVLCPSNQENILRTVNEIINKSNK
jgi:hypothetical protein